MHHPAPAGCGIWCRWWAQSSRAGSWCPAGLQSGRPASRHIGLDSRVRQQLYANAMRVCTVMQTRGERAVCRTAPSSHSRGQHQLHALPRCRCSCAACCCYAGAHPALPAVYDPRCRVVEGGLAAIQLRHSDAHARVHCTAHAAQEADLARALFEKA